MSDTERSHSHFIHEAVVQDLEHHFHRRPAVKQDRQLVAKSEILSTLANVESEFALAFSAIATKQL